MIKIVDDIRDVDIYLNLRDKVDWIKLTRPQGTERRLITVSRYLRCWMMISLSEWAG